MLSVDSLFLKFDLSRWAGFELCLFHSLVEFTRFRFMLLFVLIYPFLDALGDKTCLFLGLTGALRGPGRLHCLALGLG